MKRASYAPFYCALYPQLAEIARKHGYALAVHGSLATDFDLICIPWVQSPSQPMRVVTEFTTRFNIDDGFRKPEPHAKEHGREAWTLHIGFGDCRVDLSFMPRVPHEPPASCSTCDGARFIKNAASGPVWVDCTICTPAKEST